MTARAVRAGAIGTPATPDSGTVPTSTKPLAVRAELLLLAAVTLLGAVVRLFRLGHQPLWVDEGFSWRWAHLPVAGLWGAAGRLEYNPPLYYTLQHAALSLGDSAFVLRLPSALLGTLAIPLSYRLARDLAGPSAGLLAALLAALSGPLVAYSQEARGYALLVDAWLLAALGLARWLRAQGRPDAPATAGAGGLLLYAAGATAALYTHATAVFLPALASLLALGAFLAGGRRPAVALGWIGANLAVLLAWAWWLPTLLQHLRESGSDQLDFVVQPGPLAAAADLTRLYGLSYLPALRPFDLLLVPAAALLLLGVWRLGRERPGAAGLLAAGALGLPACLWLAGRLGRPLWLPRTLTPALPFGLVLAAVGIAALPRRVRSAAAAAAVAASLANLAGYYGQHSKEPWDEVAATIAAGWKPGDAVATSPAYNAASLRYHLDRAGRPETVLGIDATPRQRIALVGFRVPGADDRTGLAYVADLRQALAGHGRVWLALRRPAENDTDGTVRNGVAALGRMVERRELRPSLELVLVDIGSDRP